VAEARRIDEVEQRAARAAAHLLAAGQAWDDGNDDLVIAEARAGLALDPALDRAYELMMNARVRARRLAERQASIAQARQALGEARALFEQGSGGRAAARAEGAVLVDDTAAEAGALVLEALRLESAQRIENLRARAKRERRQVAEQLVRTAVAALRDEKWDAAAGAAESVLAGDDTHADARNLLRQALRREGAVSDAAVLTGARQADEGIARPEDSDATAGGGRAAVNLGQQAVGGRQSRVKSWLARLRRGRGHAAEE
jgi:hypothetical protein